MPNIKHKGNINIINGNIDITGGTLTVEDVSIIDEIDKSYMSYFDFDSNSITNISTADIWYKLNTTTTSLFSNGNLVHENNKVINTGDTKTLKFEGIISVSAGSNQELSAAFFKNEELYPCSEQSGLTGSGNKLNSIPFHCVAELDSSDFLEVYVKNKSGTDNITLDNITLDKINVIITEL